MVNVCQTFMLNAILFWYQLDYLWCIHALYEKNKRADIKQHMIKTEGTEKLEKKTQEEFVELKVQQEK